MWSCDSSTIRLGAMPKQLDIHDLNTHKLSCEHPTQIQLVFNSTSETTNYQQQTQKKNPDQHKNTRTDLRQARSRKAWQRKAGWRTRPRETGRRKRKHLGLNLRLHTIKKTSVQSHTKHSEEFAALHKNRQGVTKNRQGATPKHRRCYHHSLSALSSDAH